MGCIVCTKASDPWEWTTEANLALDYDSDFYHQRFNEQECKDDHTNDESDERYCGNNVSGDCEHLYDSEGDVEWFVAGNREYLYDSEGDVEWFVAGNREYLYDSEGDVEWFVAGDGGPPPGPPSGPPGGPPVDYDEGVSA
jgi:hypothetical protein